MKKTGFTLFIVLVAGIFFFIQNEQKQTSFGEIVSAAVEEDVEIYKIVINRFPDNTGFPDAVTELTDPEEIEKFLKAVSETKLKAEADISEIDLPSYSLNFFHYTEDLSVFSDGNTVIIHNTRMDVLKDKNPVDLAPSYTIEGQDFFSETIVLSDLNWEFIH